MKITIEWTSDNLKNRIYPSIGIAEKGKKYHINKDKAKLYVDTGNAIYTSKKTKVVKKGAKSNTEKEL